MYKSLYRLGWGDNITYLILHRRFLRTSFTVLAIVALLDAVESPITILRIHHCAGPAETRPPITLCNLDGSQKWTISGNDAQERSILPTIEPLKHRYADVRLPTKSGISYRHTQVASPLGTLPPPNYSQTQVGL